MKEILILLFSLLLAGTTANAQKGINFSHRIGAGGHMVMYVDSSAKNIHYNNKFLNQSNTSFNFLPEVQQINIQSYFKKTDSIQNFRYTILVDNKPIAVNKSYDLSQLKDDRRDFEEILSTFSYGDLSLHNKIITILTYDIEKPLDIYKTDFYGKSIPKASIYLYAKRFKVENGVNYTYINKPNSSTTFNFSEKDDELTIVKDKSAIDYLYGISIKEKKSNSIVFESTAWTYGGYNEKVDGEETLMPYVKINKNVFKKSGDYEISIEPLIDWDNCIDCNFSAEYIEKFKSRYTLSITLDEQSYSKAELGKYIGISCAILGVLAGLIMVYIKQRNKKQLAEKETQKNTAKLQLNSIRSQLNPHFLFNALSGIQNLMNKKETENANKYLAKFARLTRNVLDDKELISLSQEKTLLDDYLQMEQLRFGFNYEIIHADNLALENIEVPSMLLQPFVENAVKHGISQKPSQGKVVVSFLEKGSDLILTVTDNGNGFDTEQSSTGLGLLLSANRIALLNSIYKENHFNLAINSTSKGTEISLTLTDWL